MHIERERDFRIYKKMSCEKRGKLMKIQIRKQTAINTI